MNYIQEVFEIVRQFENEKSNRRKVMHDETFGETIRQLRRQRELTQLELARQLGVDFTYISKIEHDHTLVSEHLIYRLAEAFNVNAEYLLDVAGRLDLKQLQAVAREHPIIGVLLRRIQSGTLTEKQWSKLEKIVHRLIEEATSHPV